MLSLLFQTAVQPNCFSTNSYLQGDIQARQLVLNLVPQQPLDPLCSALTSKTGTAHLFFRKAESLGFPEFVSERFTYFSGQETVVVFLISHLSVAQIDVLIDIQTADYVVKIQQAADIKGWLNSLSYMKIDVSSCWSNQVFAFGPLDGEEQLEVWLTPNDCVIPGSARLWPYFVYTNNMTEITLAEFQVSENEGDYKYPYVHGEVATATLNCAKISDQEKKNQCYNVIKYVSQSQDYNFGVKLVYSTNGIDTDIIQIANVYQALGSDECAEKVGFTSFVHPDGFFISHEPFYNHPECLIGDDSVSARLTGEIYIDGVRIEYEGLYGIKQYGKQQYFSFKHDMSTTMNDSIEFYPQYMQYDANILVSGSFYYQSPEVKQCFYEVILMVTGDSSIQIEFRSHYFDICKNIMEEFEVMFISRELDVVYRERLNIKLDPRIPIQFVKFTLGTNVKKLLKNNDIAEFTVRGASFYFASKSITYSMDVIFLIIQLSYFTLYFVGGLIGVLVILRKQNATD